MENLGSLKKLYGLNENQLENLKQTIKLNIFPNNIEQVKLQVDVLISGSANAASSGVIGYDFSLNCLWVGTPRETLSAFCINCFSGAD